MSIETTQNIIDQLPPQVRAKLANACMEKTQGKGGIIIIEGNVVYVLKDNSFLLVTLLSRLMAVDEVDKEWK